MKLIIASNINGLKEAVERKGYDIVAEARSTSELERIFSSSEAVGNTLLVTEKIEATGSLVNIILSIHDRFPEVRIIFFPTGEGLANRFTVNQLYSLATHGIYDLYYGGKISGDKIKEILDNPKHQVDCMEIFEAYKRLSGESHIVSDSVSVKKTGMTSSTVRNNIIAVTSVKPGTGKSFVSSNLAVTLARYGKQANGLKPKILLLEGDLQTQSITTLFNIKDDEYNLKTALKNIESFLKKNDYDANKWFVGAANEKRFIDRCCIKHPVYDNLYLLEGHNFDLTDDICDCDGTSYYYLAEYLSTRFDMVVIDANSSFQHPTTDPIFQLSKTLYFVYTTDFDNLKLNIRHKEDLTKIGVSSKVRYVLNKALVGEQKKNYESRFSDEEVVGNKIGMDFKIPLVDTAVILNSTYNHKQIAMDNEYKTLAVRTAFLKLANDVMPLGYLDDIKLQIKKIKKEFKGKK